MKENRAASPDSPIPGHFLFLDAWELHLLSLKMYDVQMIEIRESEWEK